MLVGTVIAVFNRLEYTLFVGARQCRALTVPWLLEKRYIWFKI